MSGEWDCRRKFLGHEGNRSLNLSLWNVESMKVMSQGISHRHIITTGCDLTTNETSPRLVMEAFPNAPP